MKRRAIIAACLAALCAASCGDLAIGTGLGPAKGARIIDHAYADLDGITAGRIADAKDKLVVAYWHTSHGSQLISGIEGMDAFYDTLGWSAGTFTLNGEDGLRLVDCPPDTDQDESNDAEDLGNPNRTNFDGATRRYLNANPEVNVVMWSWCGQVSYATEEDIAEYLRRMSALEADYPNVAFVYMTGHSEGSGDGSDGQPAGNLHLRDRQIREYCEDRGKWLYDFYDIECYDPDNVYFGDRYVDDNCDFDADGDGTHSHYDITPGNSVAASPDRNWAIDWQQAHPGLWWDCGSAHSQPLNANRKAKAAWQLWCAIADRM